MILLSASKVRLVVQRDGGIWSFPTWTKNRSWLHRHPEVSREVVEKILLILQESQCDPLLDLVAAVSRWMFSVPDLVFFGLFPALTVRFWGAPRGEHLSIRVRSYRDQLHGPIRFPQHLFSVHDHGRQRSGGGRSTLSTLTLAWLYIEPSPCGGIRPAGDPVDSDPRSQVALISTLDQAEAC